MAQQAAMDIKKRRIVTMEEKLFIMEMVHQFREIIENKKTDGITVVKKNKKWAEICEEYNKVPEHNKKTVDQIKKIWDNEKTKKKKELAEEKRNIFRTGGGPSVKEITISAEVDAVLDEGVNIELSHIAADCDSAFIIMDPTIEENAVVDPGATPSLCQMDVPSEVEAVRALTDNRKTDMLLQFPTGRRSGTPTRELRSRQHRGQTIYQKLELVNKEGKLRIGRLEQLILHEEEFHQLRMRHEEELHQLRMKEAEIKLNISE